MALTLITSRHSAEMDHPSTIVNDEGCTKALGYLDLCDTIAGRMQSQDHHFAKLVQLVAHGFADACTVDLLDADDSIRRFACFRNAEQFEFDSKLPLTAPLGNPHCMQVSLSDGMKIYGAMLFVRGPKTKPFSDDDRLDARRLANRVLTSLLQNAHGGPPLDHQKNFSQASAIVAHELRNPLGVIKNAIDLMSIGSALDPDLQRILNEQVQKMARMVDDLLEMSRHDSGKAQLHKKRCDLQGIVASALQGMSAALAAHGQSVEMTIAEAPIWLHADPLRISQILVNLLSNASKYSESGSVIRLAISTTSDSVEIRVIDQGIGIAAEDLPNIFEFFCQSSTSLKQSEGGLGIGLALVRRLVQLHGGSVQALSRGLDQGSEFVVRLPLCDAACPNPKPGTPSRHEQPRRVLIVDDRFDNHLLVSALIKKIGPHETQSASDGNAALEAMDRFHPDVVLLDIGMPGMNGLEVASQIRRSSRFEDVLMVAVTGYDSDELRQQTREAGFDMFQLKPASIDMIRSILNHPKLDH